ncbi:MAG: HU family DNA-binding protein [Candidatus Calescibacterium sp.]|nr:HU family DNA-binding protein [Candidatus Calescibacterium sp.]MCX7971908.1 HU family DNA-binding protein [bacterium]MDW8194993.1 HU family DNA-binding protein [Candidatus Calescibacterium sp.]
MAKTKTAPKVVNKKELIESMVKWVEKNKGMQVTKKETEAILKAFLETVVEYLKKGTKVQLVPYGSWEVRQRSARKGRNPKTGQEINIPSRKVPVFKVGKRLKEAV